MKRTILFILCVFTFYTSSAQSLCEKLTQLKAKLYGFKPTALDSAQKNVKSAQLDTFWDLEKLIQRQPYPV